MIYHVSEFGIRGHNMFWVATKTQEQLQELIKKQKLDASNFFPAIHQHVVAIIPFIASNKAEMLQHAKKLAAYFEECDKAKEAVINCSKI